MSPTWVEASKAFKEDLLNHFAIGKELGRLDGGLRAYSAVLDVVKNQPSMSSKDLIPHLESLVDTYLKELEKYND